MKSFIISIFTIFTLDSVFGIQTEKINQLEHPGCPENAICSQATGLERQKWLQTLEKINNSNVNKINKELMSNNGYLVSAWSLEEARILPNTMLWNSNCLNHKRDGQKIFELDIFLKDISSKTTASHKNIYFSTLIIKNGEEFKEFKSLRYEVPSYSTNDGVVYLRAEEGKYYGLQIKFNGEINILPLSTVLNESKKQYPIDVACSKEQIDLLVKSGPFLDFYPRYICKNIWNISKNKFENIIIPMSCN